MKKGGQLIAENIKFEEEMGQSSANLMIYSLTHHVSQANISVLQHNESIEGLFQAFFYFMADMKSYSLSYLHNQQLQAEIQSVYLSGPAGPDFTLAQPIVSV